MPATVEGASKVELMASGTTFWCKHRMLTWVGGGLLAVLAVLVGAVLVLAHKAEPLLRARIVQGLSDHFHARVELDSFHVTLREGLWAEGKGLRIWPPSNYATSDATSAGTTAGPLIKLAEFRFHAPLHYRPGEAIRISAVHLKGLELDIPPRQQLQRAASATKSAGSAPAKMGTELLRFNVENVDCSEAHLTIETNKPGKAPLEFAIAHLKLTRNGDNGAMGFAAELTNPRPVGTIHTQGSFGPWMVEDPGESPIAGSYTFENADLGGFKGIAGILNSTGRYLGTLRNLVVDGQTDTPDFRLTRFGTPLALSTKFHARVDGTNGDTWLEPVEATLGNSHLWARGQIVRVAPAVNGGPGPRFGGHDIALTVNIDRGRIEDFLRLASHSGAPLLTGALTMKAQLAIPPSPTPVDERLKVSGTFALDDAQFASQNIQNRIAELSARGQGRPKDAKAAGDADVRSAMTGSFRMVDRVVSLPALEYTVPGAVIDLKGSYGIDGGKLDFAGTAKMQATVSAMVGGWKGLLLKPVDRYFRKDGVGAKVPIHIMGTRESPQFGIDFKRMKETSPQRPDEPR